MSLENTIGGKVLPQAYLKQVQQFTFNRGLKLHLDGARVMNGAVAQGIAPREITQYFDSVSICLSKGLCAPVGSLLLGSEHFIAKARRWRKMLGGGMRQAGILAAAGELALTEQVERLAEDHNHARYLAQKLSEMSEFSLSSEVQTNMVFARYQGRMEVPALLTELKQKGILINSGNPLRMVLHNDISKQDIDIFINVIKSFHTRS